MRTRVSIILLGLCLMFSFTAGCSVWRQASRPELWGLSLPESWEYDYHRSSGMSVLESRRAARQHLKLKLEMEASTKDQQE